MAITGPTLQEAMKALAKADTCKTCGKRRGLGTLNANALGSKGIKKRGFKPEVIPDDQKCTCPKPGDVAPPVDYSTEGIMQRLEQAIGDVDPYQLKAEEQSQVKRCEQVAPTVTGDLEHSRDPLAIDQSGDRHLTTGGGEGTAGQHCSPGVRKPSVGESTPASPASTETSEESAAPGAPEGEPASSITDAASQPASAEPLSLSERLRRLAHARESFARVNGLLQQRREELELELAGAIAEATAAREQVSKLETEVRAAAEDHFKATGEKKPVPGIEVKQFTVVSYDPATALEWARQSGVALSLNKTEFERIAKTGSLPFVKIDTEPRCTISQKLTLDVDDAGEPRLVAGTAVEVPNG